MTGTTVFGCLCDSLWGEPLLDPKKLQNQQFYIIDWIRKNSWSMLPIWLLAELMIMIYYWRFWEPWADARLVVLLPKLWFWIGNHDWHNCFWMSLWLFVGWALTGPKKASKSTILYNRLNKEKTPDRCWQSATCWTNDYDLLLEVLGTLGRCYVSRPVAQSLVLDWKSWLAQLFFGCLCDSLWGEPLLDPKKLQNQQFYTRDWIRKKLLIDVANLATYCHYIWW